MGMDPVTALLMATGMKVGGEIYTRNQAAKQQGKMLRNRMNTLEEYGIHPLAAAGMGGGTFSGTGGSNIGSMVSDAFDKRNQSKDKARQQAMEDSQFELNQRYQEAQIATQISIAANNNAQTRKLEEDSRTPMVISDAPLTEGNQGNAAVKAGNLEKAGNVRNFMNRQINSLANQIE